MGVISGCGWQEAGVASRWNLWVRLECIGVVSGCCKEIYIYIDFLILLIPTSLVLCSSFFCSSIPTSLLIYKQLIYVLLLHLILFYYIFFVKIIKRVYFFTYNIILLLYVL